MRVEKEEVEFAEHLLWIGDGVKEVFPEIGEQVIKIASQFLVHSIEELISKVFPQIADGYEDKYYVAHQAILTPKNDNVDRINAQVVQLFPGTGWVYRSADTIAEHDLVQTYPTEFLNSLTLSGLPLHNMELKLGVQ